MTKIKWSEWRKQNYNFFNSKLSGFYEIGKELSLLDVGSGPEQFKEITNKFNVTTFDFKDFVGTDIVADLVQPWPIKDKTYDILFASNVMEHISDPLFILTESFRVLKKKGFIIGTAPFYRPIHQAPNDYLRYTHYMLQILLERAGFTRVEISPIAAPFEVLRVVLNEMYTRTPTSFVGRLSKRIIYNALRFAGGSLRRIPPTLDLCEGYGFVAYKD